MINLFNESEMNFKQTVSQDELATGIHPIVIGIVIVVLAGWPQPAE